MSHSHGYLPTREADLLAWSNNLVGMIALSPESYGLTAAQATHYATLNTAFANAYEVANGSNRGPAATQTKNTAKRALIAESRKLVRIIQAFPGTTDTMRVQLQITVPDVEPTPVPPPADPPVLTVAATIGKTVKIRLRDLHNQDKRARPHGVTGAAVFSSVGAEPPADINDWKFEFNTSRTTVDVHFPPALAAGTQVWLTAFWFNLKKQSGPAAAPITTTLSGAISLAA
jgi:hypothetical protein